MEETKKDCCSSSGPMAGKTVKKYLCELIKEKDGFEAVRQAAKKPEFICKACGRSAKDAGVLHVPVKLED